MTLIAIQSVQISDVRDVVRQALVNDRVDSALLADFVASVDWGRFDEADATVREMLGNISGWTTAYTERDLTRSEYKKLLTSLLRSANERSAGGRTGSE